MNPGRYYEGFKRFACGPSTSSPLRSWPPMSSCQTDYSQMKCISTGQNAGSNNENRRADILYKDCDSSFCLDSHSELRQRYFPSGSKNARTSIALKSLYQYHLWNLKHQSFSKDNFAHCSLEATSTFLSAAVAVGGSGSSKFAASICSATFWFAATSKVSSTVFRPDTTVGARQLSFTNCPSFKPYLWKEHSMRIG